MRSKLALSALVAVSLVGATTIASAQMQSPPGATSEQNATTPAATGTKKMKTSKAKSGTTTGMSKSKSSNKGDMDSGTDAGGSAK